MPTHELPQSVHQHVVRSAPRSLAPFELCHPLYCDPAALRLCKICGYAPLAIDAGAKDVEKLLAVLAVRGLVALASSSREVLGHPARDASRRFDDLALEAALEHLTRATRDLRAVIRIRALRKRHVAAAVAFEKVESMPSVQSTPRAETPVALPNCSAPIASALAETAKSAARVLTVSVVGCKSTHFP